MTQLQAAALPEIKRMMALNPLSSYAAWSPRQIAGSNPAYESLFAQANAGVPGLNGLELIFGGGGQPSAGGSDGMAIPSMGGSGTSGGSGSGGSGIGMDGITPGAPPQFQPTSIQDTINTQVQAALAPAVQAAVQPYQTLSGPVGDNFYVNGQLVGKIGQSFQLGGGEPAYQVSNGQLYYQNPNEGPGWHNSYGGYYG